MYIKRLLERVLEESLGTFPAVFVGGPRQCGKTTLVKKVLADRYGYVSLDELDIRSFAVEDPRGFLERYGQPLIIDEIQNAPEILSYIKALIDKGRKPGQWVLTGSQQWPLMKGISETLAGRIAILNLHPLSLEEMNKNLSSSRGEAADYIDYLKKQKQPLKKSIPLGRWLLEGGYPEIFTHARVKRKIWYSSYIQTYIDRDVRGNLKPENLSDFEKFLKLLASRTAQELNLSTLSRDVGISVPTVKSWVSLLEASSLIYLLRPHHKNYGKRIIKSPKCFFMDTGLVCYLVGLQDKSHLLDGPMAGAIFETACVSEFIKRFSALSDPASLYFFRSTDGLEVDLIIETTKANFPIEMKLTSTLRGQHFSSLQKWLNLSSPKERSGLIISRSKECGMVRRGIYNCHFSHI